MSEDKLEQFLLNLVPNKVVFNFHMLKRASLKELDFHDKVQLEDSHPRLDLSWVSQANTYP